MVKTLILFFCGTAKPRSFFEFFFAPKKVTGGARFPYKPY